MSMSMGGVLFTAQRVLTFAFTHKKEWKDAKLRVIYDLFFSPSQGSVFNKIRNMAATPWPFVRCLGEIQLYFVMT